jgi:hypothetical protein
VANPDQLNTDGDAFGDVCDPDDDNDAIADDVDPNPLVANVAPVLALADRTDEVGTPVSFAVNVTDADGPSLTVSVAGLPPGVVFDEASRTITGTVTAAGNYVVTVTASDGHLSAEGSFSWNVTAAAVIVLENPGPQISNERDRIALQIQVSVDGLRSLVQDVGRRERPIRGWSFSATNLPAGLKIRQRTGLIEGRIERGAAGQYDVTVTLETDDEVFSVSFPWTVTAENRAPSLESVDNQRSRPGAAVSLQVNGYDPDDDPLTYTATGLPPGLSIDTATGVISGVIALNAEGEYRVMITVSDANAGRSRDFQWRVAAGRR